MSFGWLTMFPSKIPSEQQQRQWWNKWSPILMDFRDVLGCWSLISIKIWDGWRFPSEGILFPKKSCRKNKLPNVFSPFFFPSLTPFSLLLTIFSGFYEWAMSKVSVNWECSEYLQFQWGVCKYVFLSSQMEEYMHIYLLRRCGFCRKMVKTLGVGVCEGKGYVG